MNRFYQKRTIVQDFIEKKPNFSSKFMSGKFSGFDNNFIVKIKKTIKKR